MDIQHYDIFISYRRTAYNTANLIAVKLRHAGYKVFFDADTLTAGKFNEQLLEVIKSCKDFVLVLPEDALERCRQPEDWIRREVLCAMENHKNIIPVMLDGFSWPKEVPKGLEELPNYQAITAVGHEYFDMAIQRLQSYLKSRSNKPIRKLITKAGIALGTILVFILIGAGTVRQIAEVTCNDIGTQQSAAMSAIEMLSEDCKTLSDELSAFYKVFDKARPPKDRQDAEEDLRKIVAKTKKNIARLQKAFPAPTFYFNSLENYVLAYYKIEKEELKAFSQYYDSMFDDLKNLNTMVLDMIDNHVYSQLERDNLSTGITCFSHSTNAFYFGYLGSLSLLPKSARKTHFNMAKKWKRFPNGTPLDLTQEEYEQFQMQEMAKCEEEMDRFNAALNYEDQQLTELEGRIDELERKGN